VANSEKRETNEGESGQLHVECLQLDLWQVKSWYFNPSGSQMLFLISVFVLHTWSLCQMCVRILEINIERSPDNHSALGNPDDLAGMPINEGEDMSGSDFGTEGLS
jgi:hypothetical protein